MIAQNSVTLFNDLLTAHSVMFIPIQGNEIGGGGPTRELNWGKERGRGGRRKKKKKRIYVERTKMLIIYCLHFHCHIYVFVQNTCICIESSFI